MTPNPAESEDPVEIAKDALQVAVENPPDGFCEYGFAAGRVIAALEAAGFRIVHPETYTPEMMATTARHVPKPPPEMSWLSQDEWRTLLAAAPTYATPATPQKE